MGQTAGCSRISLFCVTKPSLVCALVLVPFLVLSCFLDVWFLPFLVTIPVLALSTLMFVTFKKKKVVFDGTPDPAVQAEDLICSSKQHLEDEEKLQYSETETVALVEGNQIHHEYAFKSPEIEMESESDDSDELIKSPNFELNWFCSNNVDRESTETTDYSVSASSDDEDNEEEEEDDDDSLIEISLPCENSKQKVQSNLAANLLSESIFGPEGLVELLAEINEEDNLIEIDISKFGHYELDLKS